MELLREWRNVEWWAHAACRGADVTVFFAPAYFETRGEKLRRESIAKALCVRCPARQACLDEALRARDPHGVWGGLNEMERRALVRERRQEAG
jgi:hypothetical protein